jgi:Spy/CpxP family protein refolding chaperone
MWSVLLGAALVGAALTPAGANAQGWGRGRGGDGIMLPALLRSANLTADQQSRMHDILKARRTAARPIVQSLQQAQQDLADKLLASGSVALADVQPQLDHINQLRGQLLQNSAQATLDIRAILMPDQIARAAATKDRLRQLRQEIRQLLAPAQP